MYVHYASNCLKWHISTLAALTLLSFSAYGVERAEPKQLSQMDKPHVSPAMRANLPYTQSDNIYGRVKPSNSDTHHQPDIQAHHAKIYYAGVTITDFNLAPDVPTSDEEDDAKNDESNEEATEAENEFWQATDAQIKESLKVRYRYKKQFARLQKTIAIVIDDVGVDKARSIRAVNLEGVYTLAFLPYGKNLEMLSDSAVENGHEIFLHQGAAPIRNLDPGPDALKTGMSETTITMIIDESLQKLPMAKGINNHMGSKFGQWRDGMQVLIQETHDRGLIFLDSFTHKSSQGLYLASQNNYPAIGRDVFIDGKKDAEWIMAQLQRTEKLALRDGYAVAIGHPYDTTLEIVPQWQTEMQEKGFQFVTITQLWQLMNETPIGADELLDDLLINIPDNFIPSDALLDELLNDDLLIDISPYDDVEE